MRFMQTFVLLIILNSSSFADDPLIMVYFENFAPFSWEENGQMKGIFIDVINEIAQNHLEIEVVHEGYPWARAQKMVEQGFADGFVTVPTAERREFIEAGNIPVITSKVTIFTNADNSRIPELLSIPLDNDERLKDFIILGYLGDSVFKEMYKDWSNIYWATSIDRILKQLSTGKDEIFIQTSEVVLYNILKLGLQEKIIEVPNIRNSLGFYLCINKNSGFVNILPEFNIILKQFEENGTLDQIYNKYR